MVFFPGLCTRGRRMGQILIAKKKSTILEGNESEKKRKEQAKKPRTRGRPRKRKTL